MKCLAIARELKSIGVTDIREALEGIADEETDFYADSETYRLIRQDCIDEIMQAELESDEYALGCSAAWFISDILNIDAGVIQAMQEAEAFEAIGKLLISMGKLPEMQEAYAAADGYGHYFAHYDFVCHEIGEDYYLFRVN